MIFWIFSLVALVALYVFVIRPRIGHVESLKTRFDSIGQWERFLWSKSRTVLAARLTAISGIIGAGLELFSGSGIDWRASAMAVVRFLPAQYQDLVVNLFVPVGLLLLGAIFEWLRRVTVEPLEDKE